jgi:hypothetical protein
MDWTLGIGLAIVFYSHVLPSMQEGTMKQMDTLFEGKPKDSKA